MVRSGRGRGRERQGGVIRSEVSQAGSELMITATQMANPTLIAEAPACWPFLLKELNEMSYTYSLPPWCSPV